MQTAHVIRLLQIIGNLQTYSIKYSRVTSIKKSFRLPLSQPVIRFFFFDFLSHGRSMLYRAWQLNSFSGIMNALRRNRRWHRPLGLRQSSTLRVGCIAPSIHSLNKCHPLSPLQWNWQSLENERKSIKQDRSSFTWHSFFTNEEI